MTHKLTLDIRSFVLERATRYASPVSKAKYLRA